MLRPLKNQQGLTMISWIVVIVFLLFQGVIAMNVIPVYMTDSTVKSIMKKLPNDVKARAATTKELRVIVTKHLNVNNIYNIMPEQIKITKGRGVNIVTIAYEPRGKLIGTLDYIVSFNSDVRTKFI